MCISNVVANMKRLFYILLWLLVLKISKAHIHTELKNLRIENIKLHQENTQLSTENFNLKKENLQIKAELKNLRAQKEFILKNSNCSEIAEHMEYILDGLKTLTTDVEPLKALVRERFGIVEGTEKFSAKISDSELPKSCAEVAKGQPGNYIIQLPDTTNRIQVVCTVDDWLIIQRRLNGTVNFYRSWTEYKYGFGNIADEFFIGLEPLHLLTSHEPFELLITMKDFNNMEKYARYNLFEIGDEASDYRLKELGDYSGNAGDSLRQHKLQKFTTFDRDNDESESHNCAIKFKGAWWYNSCYESNLNGLFDLDQGYLEWLPFSGGEKSLKEVVMLIRPKSAVPKSDINKALFLI